jgi:hypothetical protein
MRSLATTIALRPFMMEKNIIHRSSILIHPHHQRNATPGGERRFLVRTHRRKKTIRLHQRNVTIGGE